MFSHSCLKQNFKASFVIFFISQRTKYLSLSALICWLCTFFNFISCHPAFTHILQKCPKIFRHKVVRSLHIPTCLRVLFLLCRVSFFFFNDSIVLFQVSVSLKNVTLLLYMLNLVLFYHLAPAKPKPKQTKHIQRKKVDVNAERNKANNKNQTFLKHKIHKSYQ